MTVLPESFLKCLSKEDRDSLGKGGLTWEDALRRGQAKSEKDLQKMIVQLLRMKGIEPNVSRMDKRKTDSVGWPDITFCVGFTSWAKKHQAVFSCAWEVKFGKGQLSVEQQQIHIRLSTPPNAWRIKVIRSVDEALAELKEFGL